MQEPTDDLGMEVGCRDGFLSIQVINDSAGDSTGAALFSGTAA